MDAGGKGPRLGAHMSIAGGLEKAIERGHAIGCEAIQIFTKNSNQWKARPLSTEDVERFARARSDLGLELVVAHDSYLINLASPDETLWRKSVDAFVKEMERCEALSIPALIVHPGSHVGSSIDSGLRRVAEALNETFERLSGYRVGVWLETTAGQGSSVGHRFEHLRHILDRVAHSERVGFCFDTAHVFAAGYDLRTPDTYAATWMAFDEHLGLERLRAFHLNDSRKALGSHVDRHEHIGKGTLGLEPFRMLLNDHRFADRPMILETPKGPNLAEDVENLAVLRSLMER